MGKKKNLYEHRPEDFYFGDEVGDQVDLSETIYWQRKAERLENLVGPEFLISKNPGKRKGSKTGISVRLNPTDANKICDNFSFGKEYLKSLIEEYVPRDTRKSIDDMNYTELRRYGYVIRGVAKKHII